MNDCPYSVECPAEDATGGKPCFACRNAPRSSITDNIEQKVAFPLFVIVEREGIDDRGRHYHWLIARQENGTHVYVTFDGANIPSVTALLRDQ